VFVVLKSRRQVDTLSARLRRAQRVLLATSKEGCDQRNVRDVIGRLDGKRLGGASGREKGGEQEGDSLRRGLDRDPIRDSRDPSLG